MRSVLQVADPSGAAAILADAGAAELGLRELAPGVITAAAEPAELVAALQTMGFAPVAERPSGEPYTTPAPRRAPAPAGSATRAVDVKRLAQALTGKASGGMAAEQILSELTRAHDTDSWVDVDWVDDDGAPQSHLMRVLSMSTGVAHLVRRASGRISLPLARIVSVRAETETAGG